MIILKLSIYLEKTPTSLQLWFQVGASTSSHPIIKSSKVFFLNLNISITNEPIGLSIWLFYFLCLSWDGFELFFVAPVCPLLSRKIVFNYHRISRYKLQKHILICSVLTTEPILLSLTLKCLNKYIFNYFVIG